MYLIDSNVFISAYRSHYGFDFHPGFWDWLIRANRAGRVFSIERVYQELSHQKDQLHMWASEHKDGFFLKPPPNFKYYLETVTGSIEGHNYKPNAIMEFVSSADFHLIGYALFHQFKVVTHEVHRSRRGKIKIPPVCENLNVDCILPFEMLRHENVCFVLDPEYV